MVDHLHIPSSKKIFVLGDLILDVYTLGEVSRVSPEAPISVLLETKQECKQGGACNVAKNLLSLGMEVTLAGRIGNDLAGEELVKLIKEQGLLADLILKDDSIPTTKKNRFIASNQQMLRVDREKTLPLSKDLESKFLAKIFPLIPSFDAIVFSDYAKGFLSPSLIQSIIQLAKEHNIPTVVDPKGKDFSKYRGASVIKPNEKEAYLATPYSKEKGLKKAAHHVLEETNIDALFITRASKGISVYTKSTEEHFSAIKHDVTDVTGAGDTVLAVLAACIADQIELAVAAKMANAAASYSIEHIGCVSITMDQIHRRMLQMGRQSKIFEAKNQNLLFKLLDNRSFALFEVDEAAISVSMYEGLQKAKQKHGLLVCSLKSRLPITDLLQSIDLIDYIAVGIPKIKEISQEFDKKKQSLLVGIH